MGVTDEHWCSRCHKSLDKITDQYIEVNAINDTQSLGRKVKAKKGKEEKDKKAETGTVERFSSGLMCRECAEKIHVDYPDPKSGKTTKVTFWAFHEKIRERGNPNFRAFLSCSPYEPEHVIESFFSTEHQPSKVCDNWEAPRNRSGMNCAHLAVDTKGEVYCKRRHPGSLVIDQELAIVEEQKMAIMGDFFCDLIENSPFGDKILKAMVAMPGHSVDALHRPDPTRSGADIGKPPAPTLQDRLTEAILKSKEKRAKESVLEGVLAPMTSFAAGVGLEVHPIGRGFNLPEIPLRKCDECHYRCTRTHDSWCYMFKTEPESRGDEPPRCAMFRSSLGVLAGERVCPECQSALVHDPGEEIRDGVTFDPAWRCETCGYSEAP